MVFCSLMDGNGKVGEEGMTNQQAMKLLEEQKNGFLDEFIDYSGIVEAYNMGIRALETTTRKIEFDSIHCAACGRRLKYDAKFCDQCGRKIEAK